MAAIAIDLGSVFHARREAQSAADAAVLAAVQDLPGRASNVDSDVETYVADNDPSVPQTLLSYPGCMTASTPGICINYPYNTNSGDIQVKLIASTPTYFGKIFGTGSATVSAQAAAGAAGPNMDSAVFADSSSCSGGGITISGGSNTINGAAASNGPLLISGTGNTLGSTTYGGPNSCGETVAGGNTVNGTTGATETTAAATWPEDFSSAYPSACTETADSFTWTVSGQIPTGVYCATTSIAIKASNMTGKVTFIAPSITITGSNENFTPDYQNLSYYQTGTTTLQLAGSALNSGAVFAPNATVTVTGSSITATGFIEGQTVVIKANGFNFTGNGPAAQGSSFALLQ